MASAVAATAFGQQIVTDGFDVTPDSIDTAIESADGGPTGQSRAGENAVIQAQDAFGFSIGKETLGLYTNSNVRGFSPVAAGNVRIDGLYFDQVFRLTNRVSPSSSVKVGLSAQGNPFPSPTGIVDYRLHDLGNSRSLSSLVRVDSYGSASAEADAILPVLRDRLSLGIGAYVATNESYDGTDNFQHIQGAMIRWRPSPSLEVVPFWTRSEIVDDERGPIYVPAGPFLPPKVPLREFGGPNWAEFNSVGMTQGILTSFSPTSPWLIRAGIFNSMLDDTSDFGHLFTNLQPDGNGNRVIIADPQSHFESTSGELRVSRSITEGSRLHLIHLSMRGRSRSHRYGGFDVLDYGSTRIGERFDAPEPDFNFGPQTRDRVRQWTGGIAYEGRWENVGQLSIGVSKTDYEKRVLLPDQPTATTDSAPWLYYGALAVHVSDALALYGSYTRGLEESGVAPANAVNRNEPLPAINTMQGEVGLRYAISRSLTLVAGVFELAKPYYNLDEAERFSLLGDVRNQGLEISFSGALTPNVNLVAGAVLLKPKVTGEGVALGRVGPRPVGLPTRSIMFNADWRTPFLDGVSFDIAVSHASHIVSTRDNLVGIPARTLIDLGGRYRFRISTHDATLRLWVSNVTGEEGFALQGAGAYDIIPGRVASAYIAVDF
jgi:iron complex outermembrane receptor protein